MYNSTPTPDVPASCTVAPESLTQSPAVDSTDLTILSQQLRCRNAEILDLQTLNKKLRRDWELERSARSSIQENCNDLRQDVADRDELISQLHAKYRALDARVEPMLATLVSIRNFCMNRAGTNSIYRVIVSMIEAAPMEGG